MVRWFSNGASVGCGTQHQQGRQRNNQGSHDLWSFLATVANQRALFMIVPGPRMASRSEKENPVFRLGDVA
jgi:hypothetical protein